MLITRCPHCETAFRIQAAHLEKAEGHVRCGRCANVFDAYQELRQSLNPSLTDLAEADSDAQTLDPEVEFSSAEVDELEQALHGADEGAETPPMDAPNTADTPPIVTAAAAPLDGNTTRQTSTPNADSEKLEFNLPTDQWHDFFSDTIVGEGKVPAISDTGVEWVVLGETAIDDDIDREEGNDSDAPEPIDAAAESKHPEQLAEENDPDSLPEGHVMDLTTAAEQSPPAEDPDAQQSSLVEALFRDLEEEPVADTRSPTNYRYIGAALVLVLMLCAQFLHYNRHSLATNAGIGPLLIGGYRGLGVEISPDWNLDQYQINRWVAASDRSDAENPSLKITAQITNRGPQAQPYPLVQLALKDRWDETVAGRVFEPAEYLSDGVTADLLRPGDHIQAVLKVLDPGQDAYGFELDVCMRADDQLLQCANEAQR